MKKNLLFFICLYPILLNAQSVYHQGAVWYNDFGGGRWGACARQTYSGDTVINNSIYNKIEIFREGVGGFPGLIYYMSQFDRVFMRKLFGVIYINNDTLIPQNSPMGTKWRFPKVQLWQNCQPVAALQDTGHLSINNEWLKYWKVNIYSPYFFRTDTFIDRIGYLNSYPFFSNSICPGDCWSEYGGRLRCYSDNSFSFNNNYSNVCNFYYTMGVNELTGQSGVRVFPNPAGSFVHLENTGAIKASEMVLTDLTGREVYRQKLNTTAQSSEVDLSSLSKGVYTCSVFDVSGFLIKKEKLFIIPEN